MDQVLESVCCTPPKEHKDIKNVANSHVGVTVKRRQKRPKIHNFLLFRHTFSSRHFSGTATDIIMNNIPLEPL